MSNMIDELEDGVRVVRYPGVGRKVKWRGDCDYCLQREAKDGDPLTGFWPDHTAQSGCRSGGRDHCACDGCF